jgi:hypothetical protein
MQQVRTGEIYVQGMRGASGSNKRKRRGALARNQGLGNPTASDPVFLAPSGAPIRGSRATPVGRVHTASRSDLPVRPPPLDRDSLSVSDPLQSVPQVRRGEAPRPMVEGPPAAGQASQHAL